MNLINNTHPYYYDYYGDDDDDYKKECEECEDDEECEDEEEYNDDDGSCDSYDSCDSRDSYGGIITVPEEDEYNEKGFYLELITMGKKNGKRKHKFNVDIYKRDEEECHCYVLDIDSQQTWNVRMALMNGNQVKYIIGFKNNCYHWVSSERKYTKDKTCIKNKFNDIEMEL